MTRVEEERAYWDKAALDPEVDIKFISDVDTEDCLTQAIRPYLKYGKTLDLGCGVGRLTIPIAHDTAQPIFGLDISRTMLDIAIERAHGIPNIAFVEGDGRTLPFNNEYFESVYSMLLFQHLPIDAVEDYISEVGRVLKSQGVFRFQFIDGDEDEPFSHHHNYWKIVRRLQSSGLEVKNTQDGLLHPQWTWVAAVKQ